MTLISTLILAARISVEISVICVPFFLVEGKGARK